MRVAITLRLVLLRAKSELKFVQNVIHFSLELQKQLGSISNYHGVAGTVSYHGSGDPVRSITVMQIKNNQLQFYRQIDPVR